MENSKQRLELTADEALFQGQLSGLVMACYENERPLQGLAGLMDWRFHGALSRSILSGAVTGKAGECVYLPLSKNEMIYHLILAGAGPLSAVGKRGALPQVTLEAVGKNLSTLKLSNMGISTSDLGSAAETFLLKTVKGTSLWIAH